MKISIVAPMFNEEGNIESTYQKITAELASKKIHDFEIIYVNDGSTDNSLNVAEKFAEQNDNLTVIGYEENQGRGKALRTGIDHAKGDIICTIDFDLSYDAPHITRMIEALDKSSATDVILTSCYMPGGNTIGIPPFRLFISKAANMLYRYAFSPQIYTSTCVVRAYRSEAVKSLDLESNDKEIHLEIISKLLANNNKIKEIPGTLTRRVVGKSSFKFRSHSVSHILFFIQERPFALFGLFGLFVLFLGFLTSLLLVASRLGFVPDAEHYLIFRVSSPSAVLFLFFTAFQILAIGFIGIQNNILKKELLKMQSKLKNKLQ